MPSSLNRCSAWQERAIPAKIFVFSPYSLISSRSLGLNRPHSDFLLCPIGAALYTLSVPTKSPNDSLHRRVANLARQRLDSPLRWAGRAIEATQAPSGSISISVANSTLTSAWYPLLSVCRSGDPGCKRIEKPQESASGNDRFTIRKAGAMSPEIASALKTLEGASSSHQGATVRHRAAAQAPDPRPTSNCDKLAFSLLATRMSQARAISLPHTSLRRPRIDATIRQMPRLRRTSISGLDAACRSRGILLIIKVCKKSLE